MIVTKEGERASKGAAENERFSETARRASEAVEKASDAVEKAFCLLTFGLFFGLSVYMSSLFVGLSV